MLSLHSYTSMHLLIDNMPTPTYPDSKWVLAVFSWAHRDTVYLPVLPFMLAPGPEFGFVLGSVTLFHHPLESSLGRFSVTNPQLLIKFSSSSAKLNVTNQTD